MKEDNRLIAEFMGIAPIQESTGVYSYADLPWFSVRDDNPEKVMDAIAEYVKYDKSWDWLMPVIQKIIKTIGIKTVDECSDIEWEVSTNVTRMPIYIDISRAHHYVIEFIKWYNNESISNLQSRR